jgi:formamidopyrimidine-DNA glycosylase
MPELPEVETITRELKAAQIIGQKIVACNVRWPALVKGISAAKFKKMLFQRRILCISRRGKFIVFSLSGSLFMLVHLRMSGQLAVCKAKEPLEKHQHLILQLSGGCELRYRDTRKFGRWHVTRDPAAVLGKLGPEPLHNSFSAKQFTALLEARHRQLKPFLLDQRVIAGLGNIYTDEALWLARLHPRRISNSLNKGEAGRLFKAIRGVLQKGIRNKGTSLGTGKGNYVRPGRKTGMNQERLNVYQRDGAPCPRCKTFIRRMAVGQRSTFICPECQKL